MTGNTTKTRIIMLGIEYTTSPTLTSHDIEHCEQAHTDLSVDDYDGPETIMLSTGYALLWIDGDVTQHGQIIHQCGGAW